MAMVRVSESEIWAWGVVGVAMAVGGDTLTHIVIHWHTGIYSGALKVRLAVYNCFFCFSIYHWTLNCSWICSFPLNPIVHCFPQILSFLPWNAAGKKEWVFEGSIFFPLKRVHETYLMKPEMKKLDEKSQAEMKKEADWKGWGEKKRTGWGNTCV